MNIREKAAAVHDASVMTAALTTETKNSALAAIRQALDTNRVRIFAANQADLDQAEADNLAAPLLKRLKFQDEKLEEVLTGIDSLIGLPDPIGTVLSAKELSPELNLYQVRCPIGVLAMIFESRPDSAVQIATLALKSGNGLLLKGGKEARETLNVLTEIMHDAAVSAGLPANWLGHVTTREEIAEMLSMDESIDMIIPRGSNEFVQYIMRNSTIPVLGHADGICHTYVHSDADLEMAVKTVIDSKTQYVAVCNATETLLVHSDIADEFLPLLAERIKEKSVSLRCDPRALALMPGAEAATDDDWSCEYLDYILSVKVVDTLDEACAHINTFGSGHTDAIISRDRSNAEKFMSSVDTASALWNCSTRFADGFRYGLGAEVGISTAKIHARGPVGMEGLTIYQWRLFGNGHTVDEFSRGVRSYTHSAIDASSYPFADGASTDSGKN